MGLSTQVRNVGRFVVFVVVTLAVLLLGSGTVVYFQQRYRRPTPPPEGRPGFSFESPDDFYFSIVLRARYRDVIEPAGEDDTPVSFVVEPGETAAGIAARLEEQGLVSDASLFKTYVRFHDLDANLAAGEHVLRQTMTMEGVAHELLHAQLREIQITIVPGWRIEQIAEMLAEETAINPEEFLLVARTGTFNYGFLADRPAGSSLEGYLMADTYRIPTGADATALIERLLDTFEQRVTPEMRRDAQSRGMTIHDMVALASIVEREAVLDEERPIVASVYLNRIAGRLPEADGYLRADPTYQYARGYDPASGRWWPGFGVEDVKSLDDPYNTFLYPGLPPGPICSPSLASLKAVVYPAETNYLYFYARQDGSGRNAFAETYEEHLSNQARFGGQ
ncbi:MAG TPA: endolytic transglycosylase MltG [Anaerolineae bacterium]|nr:endolytic transglycosylase MltG [Anaerolineae bacterium]